MFSWTLIGVHPTHGRAFRRPLGASETAFFWDGHLSGTADNLYLVEVRLLNPSQEGHLFGETNIARAWLSTKRRYPLAAATVQLLSAEKGDTLSPPDPHFVIQEHDLAVLRPGEIVFGQVTCAEEAQQRMTEVFDGPRPLSDELLAQLHVFRSTNSERADILYFMALVAHCVTDETANRTLMRCFLDTLARGGNLSSGPPQIPLEARLAMAVPPEDLEPMHLRLLSPARRRWRRVVAATIFRLRMARSKGGHALPCYHTRARLYTPARSGYVSAVLTEIQTSAVTTNCRLYGITFGNAYLVLAQVAMTRVLYRRYLRGEISEEEWAYRKRQPHRCFGPLNLRPYLDKEWFNKGGGGEFVGAISVFFPQLPFMTLDKRKHQQHDLSDGAPPLLDLLTFDRFLHRARSVRKQTKAFFNHPLFLEIMQAGILERRRHARLLAVEWTKHAENAKDVGAHGNLDDGDEAPVVTDSTPMVIAHGGSSIGDVDLISPTEYPLPPSHPLSPFSPASHPTKAGYMTPSPAMQVDTTPKIVVENTTTRLHPRPGELYLGALTSSGRMNMVVFYDRNVYEDGVVTEWVDEVKAAVLLYLDRSHEHARSRL